MVDLVLYTYSKQAVRFERKGFAEGVESPHLDALGAPNFIENTGYGEASFFGLSFAARFDDFWIDEGLQFIARFGNIYDENALMHVDLRRGEANTRCGIHGFSHIRD